MRLAQLREELVETCRRMHDGDLVTGTAGNVSARDPETGLIAMSPTGMPYRELRAEDVSVVTPEGELLEGAPPSTELPGHLVILRERPDVGAVVHTHSPHATALAREVDEIAAVPVTPYVPPGTPESGAAVVAAAAGAWAAIIRGHGPFCLGRDLAAALARAFAVEESARLHAA